MKEKLNKEAQPRPKFSVFDGRRLLGLDVLGLRGVSMRSLGREGGSGVWQVRCVIADGCAPTSASCVRIRGRTV